METRSEKGIDIWKEKEQYPETSDTREDKGKGELLFSFVNSPN